jgi:hypothetical protein
MSGVPVSITVKCEDVSSHMLDAANHRCEDTFIFVFSSKAISGPFGLRTWLIFYRVVSDRKEDFCLTYPMVLIPGS